MATFDLGSSVVAQATSFPLDPKDTLAAVLARAENEVGAVAYKIANQGHVGEVVLQAARKVYASLANLKVLFKKDLEKPVGKMSDQKCLLDMANLVCDVLNQNQAALEKVSERIAAMEPENERIPRLREMPECVFVDGKSAEATAVTTVFKAKIPKLYTGKYAPALIVDEKEYKPANPTTESLTFEKVSILPTAVQPLVFAQLKGKVRLTYDTGIMPTSWDTTDYDALLTIAPGGVRLRIIYIAQRAQTQIIATAPTKVEASNDAWKEKIALITTNSIPGSSALIWHEGSTGQLVHEFVKDSQDSPDVWNISRRDGEGSFQVLSFKQAKGARIEEKTLAWGAEELIGTQSADEKIGALIFDALGFNFFVMAGETMENPVLAVSPMEDLAYKVTLKKADELNQLGFAKVVEDLRKSAVENHKKVLSL